MHSLLRLLVLLVLLFLPCFVGCSSQRSESDAERIEAADGGSDQGALDEGDSEESGGDEDDE